MFFDTRTATVTNQLSAAILASFPEWSCGEALETGFLGTLQPLLVAKIYLGPGIMSCVEPCIIVHGGATDIFRIFDTKQINQRILGVQEAAKVGYQIFLKAREQQWFIYLYPKECF